MCQSTIAEKLCIATTVSMIQLVKLQLIQKFLFLTPLSAKTFTTLHKGALINLISTQYKQLIECAST